MELIMKHPSIDEYLRPSEVIDCHDPKIRFAAQYLMDRMMRGVEENPDDVLPDPELQLARLTYEYVRGRISHSADIGSPDVTWKASDVLEKKHGFTGKKELSRPASAKPRAADISAEYKNPCASVTAQGFLFL